MIRQSSTVFPAAILIPLAVGLCAACSLNVPPDSEIFSEAPRSGTGGAGGNIDESDRPSRNEDGASSGSGDDREPAGPDLGGGAAIGATDADSDPSDSDPSDSDPSDGAPADGAPADGAPADGALPDPSNTESSSAASVLDPSGRGAVLLLYYSFDDVQGFSVPDNSGNGHFAISNGTSAPLTEPGRVGRALRLLGGTSNQHVQLPVNVLQSLSAVSVASWINLAVNNTWDRLFDFNAGDSTWFFFSPTGWNAETLTHGTHLGVRLNADDLGASFFSLTEVVQPGAWHHVAIVWAPPLLSYFLDGRLHHSVAVALSPRDLAETHQNWIGRSSYPSDPYLQGLVDEFRVYSGALSEAEIRALSLEGD